MNTAPTAQPSPLACATRAAALTALAFQADPTPEGLATMQDAIDRALALGATRADIAAAR